MLFILLPERLSVIVFVLIRLLFYMDMSTNKKIATGLGILFAIILGVAYWSYVSAPAVIPPFANSPIISLPIPRPVPVIPSVVIPEFPQGKG